jgi:hypothetical protein
MIGATGVAVTTAATPAAAAEQDLTGSAFLWANDPSTPLGEPYTPSPQYQYNSTSPLTAVNTIRRIPVAPGQYSVKFPGIAHPFITHVTAYGNDHAYCVSHRGVLNFEFRFVEAGVNCYSAAGEPVDHRFTMTLIAVGSSWRGRPLAYLEGGLAGGQPLVDFNSSGAANSVEKIDRGTYAVRLPNLGAVAGHVQVTPAGFEPVRCKVAGWGPDGTTQVIYVRCFDRNGNASDTRFSLTYAERLNILGLSAGFDPDGHDSAYAWANQPSTATYAPSPFYQFNNFTNDAATASRLGTGDYAMKFQHANLGAGNVQVTAYGWGNEYCGVMRWNPSEGIRVWCRDANGQPVDTLYDVAFTGPFVIG